MPLLIQRPITAPRNTDIALGRNRVIGILDLKIVQNALRPISPVRKHRAARNIYMAQYIDRHSRVVDVSAGKLKVNRVTQTINDRVELCCLSTPAGADKLVELAVYSPFLAPALCWCAFTLVESKDSVSISASSPRAWKMRKKVPSSRHL